ncbi:hypothetical protein DVS77_18580 [Mycolicibacterium moriokaense]|nr:hypothetical protein DVS77_18580 [Mycolicibacterium moriokaense]
MNGFVPSVIGPDRPKKVTARTDSHADSRTDAPGQVEPKEPLMGRPRKRLDTPIRVTLASELGDTLDGAWWPHSSTIGRELPGLVDVLEKPLGHVVDIDVNWSTLSGLPNLDSLNWRGNAVVSVADTRRQRVMTLTGSRATARLLVVPWRTSTALAVMLLRRAARLPIMSAHRDTVAFQVADGIVRAACANSLESAAPPAGSP